MTDDVATDATRDPAPQPKPLWRRWLVGALDGPETFVLSRELFMRGVGLVYLCAFASYWAQVDGLIGTEGIVPLTDTLERAAKHYGQEAAGKLPTLLWLSPFDGTLHFLCGSGVVAGAAVALGVLPLPLLIWLWIAYLSLSNVGSTFLGYQWDALLLETGVLAVLTAPLRVGWRVDPARPPHRGSLLLVRVLPRLHRTRFECLDELAVFGRRPMRHDDLPSLATLARALPHGQASQRQVLDDPRALVVVDDAR